MSDKIVFTLAEVQRDVAAVIDQVNGLGHPVGVTHNGQFVALISPLSDEEVMSKVLSEGPIADELWRRSSEDAEELRP